MIDADSYHVPARMLVWLEIDAESGNVLTAEIVADTAEHDTGMEGFGANRT